MVILVAICILYFRFSFVQSAFCITAMTLVLCAEIINTVVEDLCDKIEPNQDFAIGKIKDAAGAFVLVSVFGSIIVGVLVFYSHFF